MIEWAKKLKVLKYDYIPVEIEDKLSEQYGNNVRDAAAEALIPAIGAIAFPAGAGFAQATLSFAAYFFAKNKLDKTLDEKVIDQNLWKCPTCRQK